MTTLTAPDEAPSKGVLHTPLIRGGAWILLAISAALLLVEVLAGGVPVNHDCALYLQIGQMLLKGAVPYVDYVEVNPPLIHYLNVIPAAVAHALGTDLPMTFQVLVYGLLLYSTGMVLYYGRKLGGSGTGRILIATSWILFSAFIFANVGFGQREHLFALALAPWLYLRILRYRGTETPVLVAAITGLIAGLFFLLKPHFVAFAAVLDLWLLLRTRRLKALLDVEVLVAIGLGLAYVVHFAFVPDEMRHAFFGRWLPFIAANYDAYNASIAQLFQWVILGPWFWLVCAVALAATTFVPRKSRYRLEAELFALGTLMGVVLYLIQHKGFPYHSYPALACAALAIATLVAASLDSESDASFPFLWRSARRTWLVFCFCAFALLAVNIALLRQVARVSRYAYPWKDQIVTAIQEHTSPGDRIAFISTRVIYPYPALLYADHLPGIRYPCAFPIAMLYRGVRATPGQPFPYRTASTWTREERQFLEELGADIEQYRPPIIIVDDTTPTRYCPPGFNIPDYLERSGWARRYLAGYVRIRNVGPFAVYERVPDADPPQLAAIPQS